MDLGTANTIIIKDDKIVLDEPSVVAFDNRTGESVINDEEPGKDSLKSLHKLIKTIWYIQLKNLC